MKIEQLVKKELPKVQFNGKFLNHLTSNPGCYILTNVLGDILYIGQALNVRVRVSAHINSTSKTDVTGEGAAWWVYVQEVESKDKLNSVERGLLNLFELMEGRLPVLNKVRGPI